MGDRSKNQKTEFLVISADYSSAILKIKKMNLWCPGFRLSEHFNAFPNLSDSLLRYFEPSFISKDLSNGGQM